MVLIHHIDPDDIERLHEIFATCTVVDSIIEWQTPDWFVLLLEHSPDFKELL